MAYRPRASVVASSAKPSGPANSGPVGLVELGDTVTVFLDVTAVSGTSPTLDVSVLWSHDGATFFTPSPADAFTQITATGKVCKQFAVKGPYYQLNWTVGGSATPTVTFAAHEYVTA